MLYNKKSRKESFVRTLFDFVVQRFTKQHLLLHIVWSYIIAYGGWCSSPHLLTKKINGVRKHAIQFFIRSLLVFLSWLNPLISCLDYSRRRHIFFIRNSFNKKASTKISKSLRIKSFYTCSLFTKQKLETFGKIRLYTV